MKADLGRVSMRKFNFGDTPFITQLSAEAGWNQTTDDWCTLIELAPNGCLAIEVDGELAATTTLVCHGQRLAWIGMVLTGIRYRGHGFARRLLTEALALVDQMQIDTVKLDATDQGRPLYEKLGFRCEQTVERWWRIGEPGCAGVLGEPIFHNGSTGLDLLAFGADRRALLSNLAKKNPPLFLGKSYLFTRLGREASYLGPSVCETPENATALIERALQTRSDGGWYWDLLPANEQAVKLARSLDFTPKRHLIRMVRGKEQHANEKLIYAIAGFELG